MKARTRWGIAGALVSLSVSLVAVAMAPVATGIAGLSERGPQPTITCPPDATMVSTSIQDALNSGASVVCVPAGTWTISSPLVFNAGQSLVGEYGAAISGGGTATQATSPSVGNVTISNLTFSGFNAGYRASNVLIGSGWVVDHSQVTGNAGIGIDAAGSTGATIRDSIIDHNSQLGLGAYQSVSHRVENNEIAFNNTGAFDGGFEAGGGKWVQTSGIVITGNYVHDQIASTGIWLDIDNVNATVSDNVVENNGRHGIFYEISHAGTVTGNTVTGSARTGIRVTDSDGVTVQGNTVARNIKGGVVLRQDNRDALGYVLRDVLVQDNAITMCAGYSGARGFGGTEKPWDNNNRFVGNDYTVADPAGTWWFWRGLRTWSEWQGFGNDAAGSVVGGC